MDEKTSYVKSKFGRQIIFLHMNDAIPLKIGRTYPSSKEVITLLGGQPTRGKQDALDKKYMHMFLRFDRKGNKMTYRGVTDELFSKTQEELEIMIGLKTNLPEPKKKEKSRTSRSTSQRTSTGKYKLTRK